MSLGEDRPQAVGLGLRRVPEPLAGDPDGGVPGGQRVSVAVPVALERLPVAMKLPAVELDDQPMLGEQGIDLMAGDGDVDLRNRQAVPAAEGAEVVLEV